jgi:phosphoribosylaminoimidazole-succinocarboxamide synthase
VPASLASCDNPQEWFKARWLFNGLFSWRFPLPIYGASNMTSALHTSALTSLPLLARGKVRDNYAVGDDRILMVASDRISAFDVIMGEPIPGKGALLTRLSLFWFDQLGPKGLNICPIHLTGDAPESVVSSTEAPQVTGRSMLVQRLKPIPVEAVVRGYLAGSGWKEYQDNQAVCGVKLPAGLQNASKLPEPIYTPAAKAEMGEHDENITFEQTVAMIGPELAAQIRDVSIALYKAAADMALQKGIIIADTKFEFGLDKAGKLVLMDEVLTPDSSRYWPLESYVVGQNPPSYDKQFLRDWLETAQVGGKPWDKTPPAPRLPKEVIEKTAAKYQEALTRLMG